jgi:hypothetical protein
MCREAWLVSRLFEVGNPAPEVTDGGTTYIVTEGTTAGFISASGINPVTRSMAYLSPYWTFRSEATALTRVSSRRR